MGHLLYAAKIIAEKEGILDGFRVVINTGPMACESTLSVLSLYGLFTLVWQHICIEYVQGKILLNNKSYKYKIDERS